MLMWRSFSWQVFKKLQRQTRVWARARAMEMLFELFTSLLLHWGHVSVQKHRMLTITVALLAQMVSPTLHHTLCSLSVMQSEAAHSHSHSTSTLIANTHNYKQTGLTSLDQTLQWNNCSVLLLNAKFPILNSSPKFPLYSSAVHQPRTDPGEDKGTGSMDVATVPSFDADF